MYGKPFSNGCTSLEMILFASPDDTIDDVEIASDFLNIKTISPTPALRPSLNEGNKEWCLTTLAHKLLKLRRSANKRNSYVDTLESLSAFIKIPRIPATKIFNSEDKTPKIPINIKSHLKTTEKTFQRKGALPLIISMFHSLCI
ncbi:hypothetical protein AYI69_g2801 [Smittium culicis]|uniref:Uncharacterized protein n=1 Tax=Smittium culicis TaxID=133412 RepID=A0A1R1YLZ6_9FUNG|nr:hypothetical protein AYI69_g2801 [Smittium culicis]